MSDGIVIPDLGVLSATALEDELKRQNLTFKTERQSHGGHGELATMMLVTAASATLAVALAGWLLKTRHGEVIELTVNRRKPDGTEEKLTLKHKIKNEEAPQPELIAAIKEAFALGLGG